jgi:hypothetical protein
MEYSNIFASSQLNAFAEIRFGTNIPFIPVDDQSGVIYLP